MNVFITGANRGIGAGFVRHYLAQGDSVWATYRTNIGELNALSRTASPSATLDLIEWDITQPITDTAQAQLPDRIDLLINNAGVYGGQHGEQSLPEVTETVMLDVFRINAIAPIRVVQTLLPQLKAAAQQSNGTVIANMSSKMGSVDDNTSGGVYAYRASKSALCNISRSMSHDLASNRIQVITLHPGWVCTDMTAQTGLIDVSASVSGMAKVIDQTSKGQHEPGAFIAYDGQIVPY